MTTPDRHRCPDKKQVLKLRFRRIVRSFSAVIDAVDLPAMLRALPGPAIGMTPPRYEAGPADDFSKMAELENDNPNQNLKNTKIVVSVEEALEDLLVVSFTYGATSFQGVLLNSNKRNWPLGVVAPDGGGNGNDGPSSSPQTETAKAQGAEPPQIQDGAGDKLYTVCRRFTYFQGGGGAAAAEGGASPSRSCILMPRRTYCRRFGDRTARTMRLRPRQVLCSKCKSICNENSENVEVASVRRDTMKAPDGQQPQAVSHEQQQQQRQVGTGAAARVAAAGARMVLRKRRLADDAPQIPTPNQDEQGVGGVPKKPRHEPTVASPPVVDAVPTETETTKQQQTFAKTSPFIKISFGPQGTVLKIPPRTHNYTASDNEVEFQDSTLENSSSSPAYKHARAKAARKALKKAKKDAQKKVVIASGPLSADSSHKSRHHKHKFKHKRKHRGYDDASPNNMNHHDDDDGSAGNCNGVAATDGDLLGHVNENHLHKTISLSVRSEGVAHDHWDTSNGKRTDAYSEIKKECLRQKLSISLKRLSEKSYMKCGPVANGREDSGGSNHSDSNSNSEAGDLPDFPESELPKDLEKVRPLMMRISSYNVASCALHDGRSVSVGDVVWGKVHGFPWWPGKVLSISVSQRDNGMLVTQQAHVAWFGSSTSSHMPCNQLVPFLEDFKVRYNKKKRGPYKEAIKQATLAAQQVLQSVDVRT